MKIIIELPGSAEAFSEDFEDYILALIDKSHDLNQWGANMDDPVLNQKVASSIAAVEKAKKELFDALNCEISA